MASEAHLDAWEQRLQAWEAELEAREKRFREREAILQDDETTLQNALSSLEEAETASDGEETTLQDALSSLEEAEAAGGGEALGEARTLLLEGTCAKSAALALVGIAVVASTCDNDDIHLAIKAAERAVRDAFVVRCRSQAVPGTPLPSSMLRGRPSACRPIQTGNSEYWCCSDRTARTPARPVL